jgi:hypothetical protein
MNKTLRYFGSAACIMLGGLFLQTCQKCHNVDCQDGLLLDLTDKATGKDLLFGPDRFFSLHADDTTFYQVSNRAGTEEVLRIYLYPVPEVSYIELGNGDIDTLRLTSYYYQNECCPNNEVIETVQYNQQPISDQRSIRITGFK